MQIRIFTEGRKDSKGCICGSGPLYRVLKQPKNGICSTFVTDWYGRNAPIILSLICFSFEWKGKRKGGLKRERKINKFLASKSGPLYDEGELNRRLTEFIF